ncbi:MAG: DNA repair protein RecN [Muribaculaceae bacterium]|nr:DNA repair protein RecN [Muribaculaceae bacterium]MDE6447642.1 DNA repair protein RecN [Muribaculaceae bacterium]
MLRKLVIRNYALIDEVEIDFSEGLSIITGQTGAGKSIMLGALGLLLGERADTRAIADRTRKTVVEATFLTDVTDPETGESGPGELIVRREISPTGRSRAFIQDSPVTLTGLSECTSRLLDIHSQHANLSLNTREGQLAIIDAMADNGPFLADYRADFRQYVALRNRIRQLRELQARNIQKRASIRKQLDTLNKLKPKKGEQQEVERRFEMLSEADEIREQLNGASFVISDDADGAMPQVRAAIDHLESFNLEAVDPAPEEESLTARLKSIYIELKDIAYTIEQLADSVESSPALLAQTGARMRAYFEVVKAMGVDTGDDLVELRERLEHQLDVLESDDDQSRELEQQARTLAHTLKEKADNLTRRRREVAEDFRVRLTERAIPLGLANLKFIASIGESKLTPDGQDTVEFLCSFNKNGEMLPMSATASGGELSRLTLSIKSLMAEKMNMPTVIFDEIDTGVSGEIADKMGRMMTRMASRMQIITITHLPQVAAKGVRHYKVYKEDTDQRTISTVRELVGEERVEEIAGMLSGEHLTEAALHAARELLKL